MGSCQITRASCVTIVHQRRQRLRQQHQYQDSPLQQPQFLRPQCQQRAQWEPYRKLYSIFSVPVVVHDWIFFSLFLAQPLLQYFCQRTTLDIATTHLHSWMWRTSKILIAIVVQIKWKQENLEMNMIFIKFPLTNAKLCATITVHALDLNITLELCTPMNILTVLWETTFARSGTTLQVWS